VLGNSWYPNFKILCFRIIKHII